MAKKAEEEAERIAREKELEAARLVEEATNTKDIPDLPPPND